MPNGIEPAANWVQISVDKGSLPLHLRATSPVARFLFLARWAKSVPHNNDDGVGEL